MNIDFILVGQGICGTMMYRFLNQAGYRVIVIDQSKNNTASKVAAGVINPVTGRRIVKTWLIDEVMPFAKETYEKISRELKIKAISEVSIIDFFPTPQITEAFKKRYAEDQEYLSFPNDPGNWSNIINYEFGYGEITPAFLVNLPDLLGSYRQHIAEEGKLLEEIFDYEKLELIADRVKYGDLESRHIIFCDGIAGAQNPYFSNLPFAPNKGEAVLVQIDDLSPSHIYKKGFNLVPWKNNIFWLGSNYLWEFEDDTPTPGFYRFAENWLKQTLKIPFTIIDHLAGIRPATLERRPFVGFHPIHTQVGIFNGMGAKGCSLAPFFANKFADSIKTGSALPKDADVKRFSRILSRNLE
jgi:glycine/D-amino acid oxidase-like deaminating enzyme